MKKLIFSVWAIGVISMMSISAATIVTSVNDNVSVSVVADVTGDWHNVYAGVRSSVEYSVVYSFLLPTLQTGESFGTASFTVGTEGKLNVGSSNVDLYGLSRTSTASTGITGDFFSGANDTAATKLADDYFTSASAAFTLGSTVDIASWLNTMYAGGTNAGKYVFIRASNDVVGASGFYDLSNASTGSLRGATINFTAVPEPSTYVLGVMGVVGLAIVVRLRRQRF